MLRVNKTFLFALGLSTLSPSVLSQDSDANSRFYDRKAEGWFWYKEEIPVEEPEPEITKPLIAPAPQKQEEQSPPKPSQAKGPDVFSSAWFRENLPKYKDKAWDNPTIENVRVYMYLQRYAMDRSEQFADTTELAVVGDPFLDEESRRPSATFASQKLDRSAGREKDSLAQSIAKKAGIFFFFRSDSGTSRTQAPILKMLAARDGFTILPISVDGKPLPNDIFPHYKVDDGQAAKLGVNTYPALYLVSENHEIEPIAQGVLSLADIKHRIILVAKRRGWITEEQFNKTKPIMNLDSNIAALLDEQSYELSNIAKDTNNQETNFIPPEKLAEFIKQKLYEDN
ncbi:conjugal transfer protein TraF [Pseudoalteromonas sp. TAB23]|uniref:conjugal transfer protein TraF n=1 Tax=Pseudoalteromonas sp. TAB23 TaxID=1938595 RepID=UPI0003F8DE15|nr:conjugal transfer protein TraF [Pseudoalteromonas sp. TAB23]